MENETTLLITLQRFYSQRISKLEKMTDLYRDKIDAAETREMREHWMNEAQRHIGRIQALHGVISDLGDFIETPEHLPNRASF